MTLLLPVLSAGLLGALVGAFVIRRGLRGRPVDDHPVCAECAFDLAGVYPGNGTCPECGGPLAVAAGRPAPVRIGNRRRRSGMIALGTTLVALSLFLIAAAAGSASGSFQWRTLAPTWFLKIELSDAAAGDKAMTELLARLSAQGLSAGQASAIAEAALNRQGNAAAAWSPVWGDFIERAWGAGHLSDAQVNRYIRQAAPLMFSGRARMEEGGSWPYRLRIGPGRCASTWVMSVGAKLESLKVGDNEFPGTGGFSVSGLSGSGWSTSGSQVSLPGLAPGAHQVVARWSLWGQRGQTSTTLPDAKWESEFRATLEIVPPGRDTVELVTDGELRQAVVASIRAQQLQITRDRAEGYIYFDGTPLPAAFDVFWRVSDAAGGPGREFPLGSVSALAVGAGSHGTNFSGTLPAGVAPGEVDVMLRPSAATARATTDITRIWGEEIVIRGVPVSVMGAPAAVRDLTPHK